MVVENVKIKINKKGELKTRPLGLLCSKKRNERMKVDGK